jgi:hypothetical protein
LDLRPADANTELAMVIAGAFITVVALAFKEFIMKDLPLKAAIDGTWVPI